MRDEKKGQRKLRDEQIIAFSQLTKLKSKRANKDVYHIALLLFSGSHSVIKVV